MSSKKINKKDLGPCGVMCAVSDPKVDERINELKKLRKGLTGYDYLDVVSTFKSYRMVGSRKTSKVGDTESVIKFKFNTHTLVVTIKSTKTYPKVKIMNNPF